MIALSQMLIDVHMVPAGARVMVLGRDGMVIADSSIFSVQVL
ncbi:hypothetical protein [Ferruginibacter sp.]|nr:hypothetical protein [Ferruginibacter sp.]